MKNLKNILFVKVSGALVCVIGLYGLFSLPLAYAVERVERFEPEKSKIDSNAQNSFGELDRDLAKIQKKLATSAVVSADSSKNTPTEVDLPSVSACKGLTASAEFANFSRARDEALLNLKRLCLRTVCCKQQKCDEVFGKLRNTLPHEQTEKTRSGKFKVTDTFDDNVTVICTVPASSLMQQTPESSSEVKKSHGSAPAY